MSRENAVDAQIHPSKMENEYYNVLTSLLFPAIFSSEEKKKLASSISFWTH